jgi:hypothetical protein
MLPAVDVVGDLDIPVIEILRRGDRGDRLGA